MKKITLEQLKQLAINSKDDLRMKAHLVNRDITLYLHWSASHYGQFYYNYHINIDQDGSAYASTDNLSELKTHTWNRNAGSIGIALACCYNADISDFGPEPPTEAQIEAMAQIVAVLCEALDLTIDIDHVMTHAEAADLDHYGPATTCECWDLWCLPGTEKGEGSNLIRRKACFYLQNGAG